MKREQDKRLLAICLIVIVATFLIARAVLGASDNRLPETSNMEFWAARITALETNSAPGLEARVVLLEKQVAQLQAQVANLNARVATLEKWTNATITVTNFTGTGEWKLGL